MTRFPAIARIGAVLTFAVLLTASVAFGQQTTGTILGRVTDNSGAVVPGASIQIQNSAIGFSRTETADSDGRYFSSNLPLGTYSVTVQKDGFQTLVRSGIELTVGAEVTINAELVVGNVSQHVEVNGEAPQIETSNATISGLVDQDQLRDLPLNGRSIDSLALLTPGIFANRNTSGNATVGFGLHITVNGARPDWNLYLLDGTTTNDVLSGRSSAAGQQLGVEGILEFRILTHGADAEYGRYAGGIVSEVTRSGTNQFHGSVYEFWRNNLLNAQNIFATSVPEFRRNQFGAAVGGPIKKDKFFFFINYEGLRQRQGVPVITTAPVPSERVPSTTTTLPFTGADPVDASVVPYLNLYPGYSLTPGAACFNPLYVKSSLSCSIATPGATSITESVTTNFVQPTREDYSMGRLDYRFSDKDSFFARYVFDPSKITTSGADPLWAQVFTGTDKFLALGETHIFSASALNEFRFAYNRTRPTQNSGTAPGETIIGQSNLAFIQGAPSIGTVSFSSTSSGAASVSALGGNNGSPDAYVKNLFQETDTFTKTMGAHTLKFGVDVEREQLNVYACTSCNGQYSFGNLASYLIGVPTTYTVVIQNDPSINSSTYREYRRVLFGSFIQDDYRLRPNLTLNLGLRWEFETNPSEANGESAGMPNLGFAGATNVIGTPFVTPKANFSPRVGLAWDPTGSGKTSIRASGGVYDNQLDDRSWWDNALPNAAFLLTIAPTPTSASVMKTFCGISGTESGVITPNVSTTTGSASASPCPSQTSLLSISGVATGAQKNTNIQYYTQEPLIYEWNLEVQRQLANTLSLRVGYVGSHGIHLPAEVEMNTTVPNTPVPADGIPTFTKGNPRINTSFGNMMSTMTSGVSSYNALQVVLQKTTSMGLSFQSSYTYGKAISNADQITTGQVTASPASYMDPFNPGLDKSLAGFDQRHTFVTNGAYQMPWDKWVTSPLAKKLVGGWAMNGIYSYGSGLPVTALYGGNQSADGDSNNPDRPNLSAGFSSNPTSGTTGAGCGSIPANQQLHTPARWFNPCAFGFVTPGSFGNLGRNTITGPGISDMDFTILKDTKLTESKTLEFRAEAFNLLNHPMFGLPNNSIFGGTNTSSTVVYNASAGQITTTSIDNRELQLGLKLIF